MIKQSCKAIYALCLIGSLLLGCASPPPVPQQSYWEMVAEEYMHNGLQYYQRQQFRQALNQFSRALTTYQRFNGVEGELNSRINLAKTSIALNQLEAANQQIAEARRIITGHGLEGRNAHLDIMQSSIAIQQHRPLEAAAILDSYSPAEGLPEQVDTALLINRIRLAFLQQQDAGPLIRKLAGRAGKQPEYLPRLWRFQAQQADAQKDYVSSDDLYQRALQQYRNDTNAVGVLATLKEWAGSLVQRQNWQAAELRYEDMYKAAASLEQQSQMTIALQGLKQVYEQQDNRQRLDWVRQQMDKLSSNE